MCQFRGLLAELFLDDDFLITSDHQIRVLHEVESEILQRRRCHPREIVGCAPVVFDDISKPGSLCILLSNNLDLHLMMGSCLLLGARVLTLLDEFPLDLILLQHPGEIGLVLSD